MYVIFSSVVAHSQDYAICATNTLTEFNVFYFEQKHFTILTVGSNRLNKETDCWFTKILVVRCMKGKEKRWYHSEESNGVVRRKWAAIQHFKRTDTDNSRPSYLLLLFDYVDLQVWGGVNKNKIASSKLKIKFSFMAINRTNLSPPQG